MSSKKKETVKGLTQTQLISLISTKTGLTKIQTKDFLDVVVKIVEDELKEGRPVVLPNLVKFKLHNKPATAARVGINPATQQKINIPAKKAKSVIKVKLVKNLKELI